MEDIKKAIQLAMAAWVEEHGKLEDGDEFVVVFNNCTLIVSLENGNFRTKFLGGKPFEINFTVSIYNDDETKPITEEDKITPISFILCYTDDKNNPIWEEVIGEDAMQVRVGEIMDEFHLAAEDVKCFSKLSEL